jgi:hypothetical protein
MEERVWRTPLHQTGSMFRSQGDIFSGFSFYDLGCYVLLFVKKPFFCLNKLNWIPQFPSFLGLK